MKILSKYNIIYLFSILRKIIYRKISTKGLNNDLEKNTSKNKILKERDRRSNTKPLTFFEKENRKGNKDSIEYFEDKNENRKGNHSIGYLEKTPKQNNSAKYELERKKRKINISSSNLKVLLGVLGILSFVSLAIIGYEIYQNNKKTKDMRINFKKGDFDDEANNEFTETNIDTNLEYNLIEDNNKSQEIGIRDV